jgi:hypothetical protein
MPIKPEIVGVRPSVTWTELFWLTVLVIVSDVTLFRTHGFAGLAGFLAVAPGLTALCALVSRPHAVRWWIGGMLAVVVARLVWSGSALSAIVGFALLVAWTLTLAGFCPYVVSTVVHASQSVAAGFYRLVDYARFVGTLGPKLSSIAWLGILLPIAAAVVFGFVFVLANPDLAESVWSGAERFFTDLGQWLARASFPEVAFCVAVLWISAGLLRPCVIWPGTEGPAEPGPVGGAPSTLYAPFRNTLAVVIVLFAVYLVFEFESLWFRKFPPGFHYSGYAHRGAAWLTVALALASGLLSLIFRGATLHDPRLRVLKRLAWIWSAQNLVLAVAAFHRLYIYIGFNGLTRMRIVGMFGTASVVAGLLLVIWMIAHHRGSTWLVRRQLWALCVAVFVYSITPVDAIWVRYDVQRVLAGDPAPSVELSVHAIDNEGVLFLLPLLDCENRVIREGVRAMLWERWNLAETRSRERGRRHWTVFQVVDRIVLHRLRSSKDRWSDCADATRRENALQEFHKYAYQWY